MDPRLERELVLTRRQLLGRTATGIGTVALGSLLQPGLFAQSTGSHRAPKAKRVIWLFMSGAPSQMDLFDPKPGLADRFDEDLPDSIVKGQRFTTMTSGQARFPVAPSIFAFRQHGEAGTWVSELLPYTAGAVDDLCVVKSLHTHAINHDPAITFIQTGHEQPGRPSAGAWVSYGLGALNEELPAYVVLHSTWSAKRDAQALYSRLWGTGFLPSRHQGVSLRSVGDPVLYLGNPPGMDAEDRRRMLDGLAALNERQHEKLGDPEILTRIAQYEMAYRMQTSVPDLIDLSDEPAHVLEMYGPDVHTPGTFAHNALLARRMAERDVRFVQIFHRGWDQHGNLPADLRLQCRDVDQASAALVHDLKQRGLLDDTLVVWGGEFGRTAYCQGKLTPTDYGRDHHPRCFTMWLAGGGIKPGITYGETDDYSYNITANPVHVHDLNATILHCLGVDHERLTYRFQGRDYRLTDVHGNVVHDILA
ncbi:MAG: DUF1501 domain-containing protein [Planctomycetota bacterium]|nr:DUF1501 domain-containing protein [Planctomycetota bacterium]